MNQRLHIYIDLNLSLNYNVRAYALGIKRAFYDACRRHPYKVLYINIRRSEENEKNLSA